MEVNAGKKKKDYYQVRRFVYLLGDGQIVTFVKQRPVGEAFLAFEIKYLKSE